MLAVARFFLAAFLLLSLVHLQHVFANEKELTNCVQYYEKGVDAYLENRFDDCISNFENAIELHKNYVKTLVNCRIKCREEAELSDPLYPVNIENLRFFETTLKTTLCIIKCKNNHKNIFGRFNINPQSEKSFQDLKPYEYLHICYYQRKQYEKAASAAFTYLIAHPDDKIMKKNLEHYSELDGVNKKDIINYEARDYVYLYVYGAKSYELKDWENVINNMEESLFSYLEADAECRALCESPFDQGWYPDFIASIANHFTYCLHCKQKCRQKLNSLNGKQQEDLLPSHYHYLQYAYYQTGNIKAACGAVASYLLFYPTDSDMLENMKFYQKLPKVEKEFFTPRSEAVEYNDKQLYEKKLMKFIDNEFKFQDIIKEDDTVTEDLFRIVLKEKQLQGPNRFVADGLITKKQCKKLLELAGMFGIVGDGYEGKKSPHTIMEKIEGVTISRATSLVYFGLLEAQYLKLYLKISEEAKNKVQEYFKLDKELFITYTHLVCRSALPDSPQNRTDFSHDIHADSCNIYKDGHCEKSPPAYTWRDYTAMVYLNDDFDGGEFLFSADPKAKRIQSFVNPKCGRMIAFSAGAENLHGVKAVKKGKRCALGVWLTFDQNQKENDRKLAYAILTK